MYKIIYNFFLITLLLPLSSFAQNDVFNGTLNYSAQLNGSDSKLESGQSQLVASGNFNLTLNDSIADGHIISINFLGKRVDFNVENVTRETSDQVSYSSRDTQGNRFLNIAQSGDSIVGSMMVDNQLYKLRPASDGKTVILAVDSKSLVDHNEAYYQQLGSPKPLSELTNNDLPEAEAQDLPGRYTVVVAYTSQFASAAGNVAAFMALLEQETNSSYTRSGVNTSVDIVHYYQTGYSDSGDFYADRTYFRNSGNTHAATLNARRNQYKADIKIVLTGNTYSFCGLANDIGSNANDALGFASETCATGYFSFAHEVGHLFGARHILPNDPTLTPYAYGHGYCNSTSNTWRTVMSYNCPSGTGGPRVQQWSSPLKVFQGHVTSSNAAREDNARVHNVRAQTVANFRVESGFGDVPPSYWAYSFIMDLDAAGITGGCGNGNYCPEDSVTRAQMAVFLEKSIRGSGYTPPAATGIFSDVAISSGFAPWIERLFNDGITGGCGGSKYCPSSSVNREQMAVFLLKAKHGAVYTPPAATGDFDDVPISSAYAPWIEQLAAEGITGGCNGNNYCPKGFVTRAQMAVFLVKTFNL